MYSHNQQQYGQQPLYQQGQTQQPYAQQAYAQPSSSQTPYTQQPYGQQQAGAQASNTSTTTTVTTTQQLYGNQQHQQQVPHGAAQPANQLQSSIDYTQLQLQLPSTQPQPTVDYTKLIQTPSSQQNSNTTTTSTNTLLEQGGQARQSAAAKGDAELRRFDKTVQEMLMSASSSACPFGFKYYRGPDGYLCGGGSHYVSHGDVDAMVMFGRPPFIEVVNDLAIGCRPIAPPADGWHEPMHWTPARRLANDMPPMPFKANGLPHDLGLQMGTFRYHLDVV